MDRDPNDKDRAKKVGVYDRSERSGPSTGTIIGIIAVIVIIILVLLYVL